MEVTAKCRINEFGRITIPREIRNELNLYPGDVMEIGLDDNGDIVMHRLLNQCLLCKSVFDFDDLIPFKGFYICKGCVETIRRDQENG